MRAILSRIVGCILLLGSLVLLIASPGKADFSMYHFYLFIACFVTGMLLITGFVGTHPAAAQLRRAAIREGIRRAGPLCHVAEQSFPYAGSTGRRRLVSAVCALIGLGLVGVGLFIERMYPSKGIDSLVAGMPPLAAGLLCLWISVRYPSRQVLVGPQEITLRGYFRTVKMPWHTIVALIAREHQVLTSGGFVSTGIMYTLYTDRRRLWFSSSLPGSERLASIISQVTGLTWDK